jgi:hypothetical protein
MYVIVAKLKLMNSPEMFGYLTTVTDFSKKTGPFNVYIPFFFYRYIDFKKMGFFALPHAFYVNSPPWNSHIPRDETKLNR